MINLEKKQCNCEIEQKLNAFKCLGAFFIALLATFHFGLSALGKSHCTNDPTYATNQELCNRYMEVTPITMSICGLFLFGSMALFKDAYYEKRIKK